MTSWCVREGSRGTQASRFSAGASRAAPGARATGDPGRQRVRRQGNPGRHASPALGIPRHDDELVLLQEPPGRVHDLGGRSRRKANARRRLTSSRTTTTKSSRSTQTSRSDQTEARWATVFEDEYDPLDLHLNAAEYYFEVKVEDQSAPPARSWCLRNELQGHPLPANAFLRNERRSGSRTRRPRGCALRRTGVDAARRGDQLPVVY